MPREIDALAGPSLRAQHAIETVAELEQRLAGPATGESVAAGIARLETTMYLRHQLLRDVDVMSMAHGLEVRVPLVDHELIGAVWPALGRFPELLAGKRLLSESVGDLLPPAVSARRKVGFTLPFATWLDGPLAPIVRDGLEQAARQGWLAPRAPEAILRAWRTRACHWSRPWGLAVLGHVLHDARA
jgi:asparagine synthase (glutamine-hydrolysing)